MLKSAHVMNAAKAPAVLREASALADYREKKTNDAE
jgi:hypothetical protein